MNMIFISYPSLINIKIVQGAYETGVSYALDYSMDPVGIATTYSLQPSYISNILACAYLTLIIGLVLMSWFPRFGTRQISQATVDWNRTQSESSSDPRPGDLNLQCSNLTVVEAYGTRKHHDTFVYDRRKPSGSSIMGLFDLGPPVVCYPNGRRTVGFMHVQNLNSDSQADVAQLLNCNRNNPLAPRSHFNLITNKVVFYRGAHFKADWDVLRDLKQQGRLYSGSIHFIQPMPESLLRGTIPSARRINSYPGQMNSGVYLYVRSLAEEVEIKR